MTELHCYSPTAYRTRMFQKIFTVRENGFAGSPMCFFVQSE
jgi:hypothetical protein